MTSPQKTAVLAIAAFGVALCSIVAHGGELDKRATWALATPGNVREKILEWSKQQEAIDDRSQLKIDVLWPKALPAMSGSQLLEQVTATFALVDERANALVQFCRGQRSRFAVPEFPILNDKDTPEFVKANLRLLLGRWLAQQQLYDESLEVIQDVKPADVVDPASLLFYQGVSLHRALNKKKCLPILSKLLEREDEIPRRYASVAKLMEADLKPLKENSLDEIARLMGSIHVELEHARAGKRVRDRQNEVIAKLEKMIDDLEQQRQQQQSQSGSNSESPGNPAEDSVPLGGSGRGKVPPKKLGSEADWGNIPPKQREEALQQISKEFPSHFREVIEEYFRKLARDEEE